MLYPFSIEEAFLIGFILGLAKRLSDIIDYYYSNKN